MRQKSNCSQQIPRKSKKIIYEGKNNKAKWRAFAFRKIRNRIFQMVGFYSDQISNILYKILKNMYDSEDDMSPGVQSDPSGNDSSQNLSPVKLGARPIKFLDNKNSPYHSAPKDIQDIFEREDNGNLKIKTIEPKFELRRTETNCCSRTIKISEKMYVCEQCCNNERYSTSLFCEGCFIKQKHQGHSYEIIPCQRANRATCDCGFDKLIKPEAFCPSHSSNQIIKVKINEKDKDEFFQYFYTLFDIGLYCLKQREKFVEQLFDKIFSALNRLNEGSVYYNRLTFELFQEEYMYEGKSTTFMEELPVTEEFLILARFLSQDLHCLIEVMKMQCKKNDDNRRHRYDSKLEQILVGLAKGKKEILEGLAEEGLFDVSHIEFYMKENEKQMDLKKMQLFLKLFKYLTASSSKFFDEIYSIIRVAGREDYGQQASETILKYCLSLYEKEPKVSKWKQRKMKNKGLEEGGGGMIGQFSEGKLVQLSLLTLNLILKVSKGSKKFIIDIRKYVEENEMSQENIDYLLQNAALQPQNLFQGLMGDAKDSIVFCLLLVNSPKKKQILNNFWNKYAERNYTDMYEISNNLFTLVSAICNMDLSLFRFKSLKNREKTQLDEEDQVFLRESFKSFLFENKVIQLRTIWKKKENCELQFKGVGKILEELCRFDEENQIFIYTSKEKFPNNMQKFTLTDKYNRSFAEQFISNGFNLSSQFSFNDQLKQNIIKDVLGFPQVFQILKKKWQQIIADPEELEYRLESYKEMKFGFIYIIMLVILHKLTQGADPAITKQLEKLKKNPEERFNYEYLSDKKFIEIALGIENAPQTQQEKVKLEEHKKREEEQEQKRNDELKKKADQKKNKYKQKFKKKRQLVLQKSKSKVQSVFLQDEDTCILCHERAKKGNQLVYLSSVNQGNTLSYSIHQDEDKANCLLKTCFHTIHLSCFLGIKDRKVKSFIQCPLCHEQSNCILPVRFIKEEGELNRIVYNIIVTSLSLTYDVYDIQSIFALVFKHLISSKGLNALISFSRYQQEKNNWRRNDDYLIQLLTQIYEASSSEEKEFYQQSVKKLSQNISQCKKKSFMNLQNLLLKALKSKIMDESEEIDINSLLELQKSIKADEFMIIQSELEGITQEKVELPEQQELLEQIQKQSLSFNVLRPPANDIELQEWKKIPCDGCSMQKSIFRCLLCSESRCSSCFQYRRIHPSNLLLAINQGRIHVHKKNEEDKKKSYRRGAVPVYFNEVMAPLEMKERAKNFDKDTYTLSEKKFNESLTSFLDL